MKELCELFQGIEYPRRSSATRHDLREMLMIGLLSMLTGGRTCVDMEAFGHAWEPRLRELMKLGHGIPSHDAFSDLFKALAPSGLGTALLRMAQDWGDALGDVVAVDGKALRRSFEDAAQRSALPLVQAFAAQAKLTLAQLAVQGEVERDSGIAKAVETAGLTPISWTRLPRGLPRTRLTSGGGRSYPMTVAGAGGLRGFAARNRERG